MPKKTLTLLQYRERYGEAADYIWRRKKEGVNLLPWCKTLSNIRSRCRYSTQEKKDTYIKKGVRCMTSSKELKALFYRDRAWEMERPSIDRIDPEGDYTFDNMRWIEFSENRVQRLMNNPFRKSVADKLWATLTLEFEKVKWPTYVRRAFLRRCLDNLG